MGMDGAEEALDFRKGQFLFGYLGKGPFEPVAWVFGEESDALRRPGVFE
jgi:hypothetical protein